MISSPAKSRDADAILREGSLVSAYRIECTLGVGGMGCVFRARHTLSSRVVALKVMREEQLLLERSIDRMMREATILASVSHPGIPRFFECGLLDDGRAWIAMELVEGAALARRMHGNETLPADDVATLIGHVAGVLAAAHARGVTHRDLKPENIFLTPHDAAFPVRLIDWGIAHHHSGARYTSLNEAIGTPTYMSPEQARGGPADGYCDIYGLGVVAYQALTGRAPFVGASSVEILVQHLNKPVPPLAPRCPEAPIGIVELVERMLCKRHEDRPSAEDVSDLVAGLRGVPRSIDGGATAQLRVRPVADVVKR
jgi:eukaryotic-like serine/threonine-protein kinase